MNPHCALRTIVQTKFSLGVEKKSGEVCLGYSAGSSAVTDRLAFTKCIVGISVVEVMIRKDAGVS